MSRRTDFQSAITYTGQKLKGEVTISRKIDGVRLLWRDNHIVTRNNKVPRGLDRALSDHANLAIQDHGDVEVYTHGHSFGAINGMLHREDAILDDFDIDSIYPLVNLDHRLYIDTRQAEELTPFYIYEIMRREVAAGYEGLVLRTAERWYRVKPKAQADVFITGFFEQVDKHGEPKCILGGFDTNWGKVTAFTEECREQLWVKPEQYIGRLMTVTYRERYHTGKFRYCVTFDHFRDDKHTESFDTEPPLKGN